MIDNYNYILSHWREYNLTDTREDFVKLLNILEALNENIDTLHNAVFNEHEWFGTYWIRDVETDRDVVDILFYFNTLWTVEDLKGFLYELMGDCWTIDEIKETFSDNDYSDDMITRTRDGYVHTIAV